MITSCIMGVLCVIALFYLIKGRCGIAVDAEITPLTHSQASRLILNRTEMKTLRKNLAAGIVPESFAENHHKTLAYIRATLETACLNVLQSIAISKSIRDIGGSLTRNAFRGKALHICSPSVDSTDVQRKEVSALSNEVHNHYGHECNKKNFLSNMTYVDFHMTQEQLVASIGAPTFVITHDFTSIADGKKRSWFGGEAEVTVTASDVTMKTTGGTTYQHGYHKWDQDGVIVAKTGAVNYVRVFDEPATKSMILLLTPISGRYTLKDNTLRSTATAQSFKLTSGGEATREDSEYHIKSGIFTYSIPVSTINRVAFQMAGKARDEKWKENLCSMLRGRFQMDKVPMDCILESADLCIMIADTYAASIRDSYITNPNGLNFIQKFLVRYILPTLHSSSIPYIGWALNTVLRWSRMAPTPWLWKDITVHNYEINYPRLAVTLLDTPTAPVEPFREAGEDDSSPSPNEQRRDTREDPTESSHGDRQEADGNSAASSPSTTASSTNKERDDKTYIAPPLRSGARTPKPGNSRGIPKTAQRDVVRVAAGIPKDSHPAKGARPNNAVGRSSKTNGLQGQQRSNKGGEDILPIKNNCKHPDHPAGPKCFKISDKVPSCVTRQQVLESKSDKELRDIFGPSWTKFVKRPVDKRQNIGQKRRGLPQPSRKPMARSNQPPSIPGMGKSVQECKARGTSPRSVRSDRVRNTHQRQHVKELH
jgi:hypothetical protein